MCYRVTARAVLNAPIVALKSRGTFRPQLEKAFFKRHVIKIDLDSIYAHPPPPPVAPASPLPPSPPTPSPPDIEPCDEAAAGSTQLYMDAAGGFRSEEILVIRPDWLPSKFDMPADPYIHTYTHMYTYYIYIYIYLVG